VATVRQTNFISVGARFSAVNNITATSIRGLRFLSVPVHNVTYAETLEWVGSTISANKPHYLCTVNPEFVMTAQTQTKFLHVLQNADLCLPDGQGMLWAARRRGFTLRQRVAGSTLLGLLAERAAKNKWRMFFLGAKRGVAARAASILESQNPGLPPIETMEGSPRPEQDAQIIERVRAASPDILLVAFGAPKQELWIHRQREILHVPIMMGVGGAFDFVAGVTTRAPLWAQRLGLEWLHRLLMQPWRWRRMLALPKFAWEIISRPDSVVPM